MADDSKLTVQIVLDDGSIVNGFAKIEKQAEKTAEKASSSFEDLEKNFSVDGIKDKIASIGPEFALAIGVGTAAVVALGVAFDQALKGEKLEAMEKQFQSLAQAAGLSGDAIESGLVAASDGMFDLSDNIGVVNEAIINLGSSAAKLPEIMMLARKSAAATGGDFEANFKTIINAIESGNVKALRQAGIFIDADKALGTYAKTLGITAGELTIAQKQQALLNAALVEGEKKFKDITTSMTPMQDSLKRIGTAWNEIKDATAKGFKSNFGEAFAYGLELTASAMGSASSRARVLESDLEDLKKRISFVDEESFLGRLDAGILNSLINKKQAELDSINKTLEEAKNASTPYGPQTAEQAGYKPPVSGLTPEQIQGERDRQNVILGLQNEANQAYLTAEMTKVAGIKDIDFKYQETKRLIAEQEKIDKENHERALLDIQKKYSDDAGFDKEQRRIAEEAENKKFAAKKLDTDMKYLEAKNALEKKNYENGMTVLNNFASLQNSTSKEAFEVGKAAAIASATISAYGAINETMRQGGAFALPLAISIGVAAFANVAKIASTNFGDKGAGAGAPSLASAGGGGINAGISTPVESPALANNDTIKQEPATKIEVNFAGNNLNTRESSLHIVELLNEAFEQHGAIVKGAV